MKKAVSFIGVLAVMLFVAGCAQSTPEEKYLSHWEKIVSLIKDNKTDAAKAQTAVKSYLDGNLADMKTLSTQFGKEESKNIAKNSAYIMRVLKLVDTVNELAKTNKALLDDPQLAQAYAPLADLTK
jgi:hypothetical protein